MKIAGETVSQHDVVQRMRARQTEVFDQICKSHRMSPFLLSQQPDGILRQLISAVIGKEPTGNVISMAKAYAAEKGEL